MAESSEGRWAVGGALGAVVLLLLGVAVWLARKTLRVRTAASKDSGSQRQALSEIPNHSVVAPNGYESPAQLNGSTHRPIHEADNAQRSELGAEEMAHTRLW